LENSTLNPRLPAPLCKVELCGKSAQVLSKKGETIAYMKTCLRHDYRDLPEDKNK
jgi:hypothetical protein